MDDSRLKSLTQDAIAADSAFAGFGKRLASLANTSSKASKNWTIFSRLVSGTPIWALQNKLRAYVDILAQVDERQKNVNKQYNEQLTATAKNIKEFSALKNEYDSLRASMGNLTHGQKELVEGTNSYIIAIASGVSESVAFQKGLDEITHKYKAMETQVNKTTSALQLNEKLKTGEGSKEVYRKRARETTEGMSRALDNFGMDITAYATTLGNSINNLAKFIGSKEYREATKDERQLRRENRRYKIAARFQTKLLKFADFTKGVFTLLQKYIIMGMFVAMGIIAAIAIIKAMSENLDFGDIMERIGGIVALMASGIGDIVGLMSALLGGDLEAAMMYMDSLLDATLTIALEALKIALMIGLELVISTLRVLPDLLFKEEYRNLLLNILMKALIAYSVVIGVKMLAIALLQVAAIYALPVLIGLAVGAVIISALSKLIPRAGRGRATGGLVNESMTLVGERGPELVSLPTGSKVYTNNQTKKMTGGVTNNFNITIHAKDTSDAELRRIAEKLGGMISSKINRRNSSSTMR